MTKLSANGPLIHPRCSIDNSDFGAWTEIGTESVILNSSFGDYAYCGRFCDIANTSVGRFANIASNVRAGPTDHPMTHASQHHFLYRSSMYWDDVPDDADFFAARAARRTVLGHDCWIGHGAIIKPDVTLGIGAIVASGAVVTGDVAPFMIMAGIPARPLRSRFAPDICERLLALAWWDWDHDRLRQALPDFRAMQAEAFLEKYRG